LVRAPVLALIIGFGGPLIWLLLWRLNLRTHAAIPWAAAVMLAIIVLAWRYFAGWGWPAATSAARQLGFRQLWPAAGAGTWTSIAVVATTVASLSMIFLGLRIGHFSNDEFAGNGGLSRLPAVLAWSMVVMTSICAGFFEEVGFRGYLQSALERRYGPVFAIALTSILFWAMHLDHDWARGNIVNVLAIAIPFFATATLWGVMAYVTSSIGPSVIAHAVTDLTALPLEWNLAGQHNLTPVATTGLDRHFVSWSVALAIFGVLAIRSLHWLGRELAPARIIEERR